VEQIRFPYLNTIRYTLYICTFDLCLICNLRRDWLTTPLLPGPVWSFYDSGRQDAATQWPITVLFSNVSVLEPLESKMMIGHRVAASPLCRVLSARAINISLISLISLCSYLVI